MYSILKFGYKNILHSIDDCKERWKKLGHEMPTPVGI